MVNLYFLFLRRGLLYEICMACWNRWLSLELSMHHSDHRQQVRVAAPLLQRVAGIHQGLPVDAIVDDIVHDLDRWSLRGELIGHHHFDEERSR